MYHWPKLKKYFLILSISLIPSYLLASAWIINPDHSNIFFDVSYLKVANVTGKFNEYKGKIEWEIEHKLPKYFELKIASDSVDSGNSIRDTHLKDRPFFYISKFPVIEFSAKKFEVIAPQKLKVLGFLKLKGIEKQVNVLVEMSDVILDTWNQANIFVNFQASLKRSDYGFFWNKSLSGDDLLISDDVFIHGALQFQPQGKQTAGSRLRLPDNKSMRFLEKINRGEIVKSEMNQGEGADSKVEDQLIEKIEFQKPQNGLVKKKSQDNTLVNQEVRVLPDDNNQAYLAFLYLSFLGFIAIIQSFYFIKKAILKLAGEKYEETKVWGLLGDLLGLLLTLLYANAVYYLGDIL